MCLPISIGTQRSKFILLKSNKTLVTWVSDSPIVNRLIILELSNQFSYPFDRLEDDRRCCYRIREKSP